MALYGFLPSALFQFITPNDGSACAGDCSALSWCRWHESGRPRDLLARELMRDMLNRSRPFPPCRKRHSLSQQGRDYPYRASFETPHAELSKGFENAVARTRASAFAATAAGQIPAKKLRFNVHTLFPGAGGLLPHVSSLCVKCLDANPTGQHRASNCLVEVSHE
jgi:hypothetical protein